MADRWEGEEEVRRAVWDAVKSLRFGSVEIVVHDGRVIQVEKREKTRFDSKEKP
jgi:hypothetical protein